jgi:hypothetical protein
MLTGQWIGRFSYDQAHLGNPVAFEVTLREIGGSLTGESTEPNTFRPEPLTALRATITGWREGGNVGWRKTYGDFVQGDSPAYSGVVNAAETRIIGTWSFPRHPGMTGSFSMHRAPGASARRKAKMSAPLSVSGD